MFLAIGNCVSFGEAQVESVLLDNTKTMKYGTLLLLAQVTRMEPA
jgi:hypothetical protein